MFLQELVSRLSYSSGSIWPHNLELPSDTITLNSTTHPQASVCAQAPTALNLSNQTFIYQVKPFFLHHLEHDH